MEGVGTTSTWAGAPSPSFSPAAAAALAWLPLAASRHRLPPRSRRPPPPRRLHVGYPCPSARRRLVVRRRPPALVTPGARHPPPRTVRRGAATLFAGCRPPKGQGRTPNEQEPRSNQPACYWTKVSKRLKNLFIFLETMSLQFVITYGFVKN
jgi:hypothetical protein